MHCWKTNCCPRRTRPSFKSRSILRNWRTRSENPEVRAVGPRSHHRWKWSGLLEGRLWSYCLDTRRYWSIIDREIAYSDRPSSPTQVTCSIVATAASVSSSHAGPQLWTRTDTSTLPSFPSHSTLPSSRLRIASAVLSNVTAIASYSSAVLPSPIVQSWPFIARAVWIMIHLRNQILHRGNITFLVRTNKARMFVGRMTIILLASVRIP